MSERFTAWITKYALTTGIRKTLVEQMSSEDIVWAVKDGRASWTNGSFHGEGQEWHRTPEGAIERAEAMRQSKLKSLDKQRAKIAALKFTPEV